MESNAPLEERLTATYLRALKNDCFSKYGVQDQPLEPMNFRKDYAAYTQSPYKNKAEAFERLKAKYSGYFKAKEKIESENDSNKYFLGQMYAHFKDVGMEPQAEKCRLKIQEFYA